MFHLRTFYDKQVLEDKASLKFPCEKLTLVDRLSHYEQGHEKKELRKIPQEV